MHNRASLIYFVFIFIALQGCVAVQTFPLVARQGDTITLAIGSQDDLTKDRITLEFVSDNPSSPSYQIPIDISSSIRNIIRLFPDKTSRAWVNYGPTMTMQSFVGHGAWQNIMVVDLPVDIPNGPGLFKVTFSPAVLLPNTAAVQNVEDIDIGIEILDAAEPEDNRNNFNYYQNPGISLLGNLALLQPMSQVVVRYGRGEGNYFNYLSGKDVSAAEYKLKIPVVNNESITNDELHVVLDERPGFNPAQAQVSWSVANDVITVNIVFPTSFTVKEASIRYSLIIDGSIDDNTLDITGTPELLSHRYFDLAGLEIVPQYTPEAVIQK